MQINDREGTPLMAVGTEGGAIYVLPIGQATVTAIRSQTQSGVETVTPVFTDETISIMRKAGNFIVRPIAKPCGDPVQCSKPIEEPIPLKRSFKMKNFLMLGCDPIQCSKPAR